MLSKEERKKLPGPMPASPSRVTLWTFALFGLLQPGGTMQFRRPHPSNPCTPRADPQWHDGPEGCITVAAALPAGSAVAANMDRGSVPSRTLLSGSTTQLEDDEDVEEVLPFRLSFFVFDSVTCGEQL